MALLEHPRVQQDEPALSQLEGHPPHDPGVARPPHDDDRDDEVAQALAQQPHDHQGKDERGQRQEDVGQAHDDRGHHPAVQPRHQAEADADQGDAQRGGDGHAKRGANRSS